MKVAQEVEVSTLPIISKELSLFDMLVLVHMVNKTLLV
jgi:hypothetical protein